jgi:hypothetical protein
MSATLGPVKRAGSTTVVTLPVRNRGQELNVQIRRLSVADKTRMLGLFPKSVLLGVSMPERDRLAWLRLARELCRLGVVAPEFSFEGRRAGVVPWDALVFENQVALLRAIVEW